MRNTNPGKETLAKISEFKKLYTYDHVEAQLSDLLYTWVSGDIITTSSKIERENTLQLFNELKSLMKFLLDDQLLSDEIINHYLLSFYDNWSLTNIKDKIRILTDSFILSDLADDKNKRSNVFDFLNQTNDLIFSNNQV
jgi:hypothetical protein